MQLLVIGVALIGFVCGDVSHLGYKYTPPTPIASEIKVPPVTALPQYILPVKTSTNSPLPAALASDYIPPTEVEVKVPLITPTSVPTTEYIPPSELKIKNSPPAHIPQPVADITQSTKPVKDGYNYIAKPIEPVAPVSEDLSPQVNVEPAHQLANDGYRYKTVRKIKYRYRS